MAKPANEVINEILDELEMKGPTFAKMIGLKYQRISDIQRGVTKSISGEVASAVKASFPQFNIEWILTGQGGMFVEMPDKDYVDNIVDNVIAGQEQPRLYPLIPIEAVAGFGEDSDGVSFADCEKYAIPEFEKKGMEFLIRVSGSSMYPKYSNGDVLACRKIREILFFQWGKIYVIDSSQGQLIKRIYEDAENPDNVVCVSENKERYPAFSIPKSDIRSLSIVIGVVKLE